MIFRDRAEAGKKLADELYEYAGRDDCLVLALPRGGVPVAYEVARRLKLPLDVFLVRKLGVPGHEELAMGAIASGGTRVVNENIVRPLHISQETIDVVSRTEQRELDRRERAYRDASPPTEIRNKIVILVDDGLATGATMRAAAAALKQRSPKKIVVAVPVAARETCEEFRSEVDSVVCAATPHPFRGVGLWYKDFSQTTDQTVRRLLARARASERCH